MAGKRMHAAFKPAIGQLTVKFEAIGNKGIGKLSRLLAASKFEEIGEVVDSPRGKFRHVRETPVFYSEKLYGLPLASVYR
jgi:hypothetical protein